VPLEELHSALVALRSRKCHAAKLLIGAVARHPAYPPESCSSARSVGGSCYDDRVTGACKAMFGMIMLASCSHPRVSSRGGGPSLPNLLEVRHITVSIDRLPEDIYEFASKIENLPKWATELGKNFRNVDGEWVADSATGQK